MEGNMRMMGMTQEGDLLRTKPGAGINTNPVHAMQSCKKVPEIVRQKCFRILCKFFQWFLIDFFSLYLI